MDEHFTLPDDGGYSWVERGKLYRGWSGHDYKLIGHHRCGFHLERVDGCDGKCARAGCEPVVCVSARAIGRTYHLRRGT